MADCGSWWEITIMINDGYYLAKCKKQQVNRYQHSSKYHQLRKFLLKSPLRFIGSTLWKTATTMVTTSSQLSLVVTARGTHCEGCRSASAAVVPVGKRPKRSWWVAQVEDATGDGNDLMSWHPVLWSCSLGSEKERSMYICSYMFIYRYFWKQTWKILEAVGISWNLRSQEVHTKNMFIKAPQP